MLLTHHGTGALPPSAYDTGDRKPFSADNFAGFLQHHHLAGMGAPGVPDPGPVSAEAQQSQWILVECGRPGVIGSCW
jgi:hypothetical protein